MLAAPLTALDRPLKVVIWQARPVVLVSCLDPAYLGTPPAHRRPADPIAGIDTITAAVVP